MDFPKAFDTVPHKILLQKLYDYGIRGPAYSLIESYLTNRKQFVSVNNNNFLRKPINIGSLSRFHIRTSPVYCLCQ